MGDPRRRRSEFNEQVSEYTWGTRTSCQILHVSHDNMTLGRGEAGLDVQRYQGALEQSRQYPGSCPLEAFIPRIP